MSKPMTTDDVKLVREIAENLASYNFSPASPITLWASYCRHFLDLYIEAEWRREKAEWKIKFHNELSCYCLDCRPKVEEKNGWSDLDWKNSVLERLGLEKEKP